MLSKNKSSMGECFNISSSISVSDEELIRLFEINNKKKTSTIERENDLKFFSCIFFR